MRLLIKSICYRLYATLITIIIAYFITNNIAVSVSISLVENLCKLFTYALYDIWWHRYVDKDIKPCVILLTGLSGAGKTTIADKLRCELAILNKSSIILDGDDIRNVSKLSKFDEQSRKHHNRHMAQMASLFEKQGNIVIIAAICPYRDIREEMRNICTRFFEIHISTPLNICVDRDTKGLYKKALDGEIKNLTGFNAPYEFPLYPDMEIDTSKISLPKSIDLIIKKL